MLMLYLTVAILLLLISIVLCVMLMNEVIYHKMAGKETFEFFGMKVYVPRDEVNFIELVGICVFVCFIVSLVWPFGLPVLFYYKRFRNIQANEQKED